MPDRFYVILNPTAGTYVTASTTNANCEWVRFSEGYFMIAHNFGPGQQIVTISDSDYGFEALGCGQWVLLKDRPTARKTTITGTGVFSVEKDIVPGTYRANFSAGYCYWATLSSFSDPWYNVITWNEYETAGTVDVVINSSMVGFETYGCGTWTKLP